MWSLSDTRERVFLLPDRNASPAFCLTSQTLQHGDGRSLGPPLFAAVVEERDYGFSCGVDERRAIIVLKFCLTRLSLSWSFGFY